MTEDTNKLLTPQETAGLLRISKRSLFRHFKSKKIPQPIRVGGVLRWKLRDLQAFIEGAKK